jgi:hypothetical protein
MAKPWSKRKLVKRLKEEGFDESLLECGVVFVKCSRCAAAVIQGVACHERGCPNVKRTDGKNDE